MIKNKILYIAILVALFMFYILFIDSMSLIIFILAVIFPCLQFLLLNGISKNITAELNTENITLPKNKESKIILNISNSSFFPVSCAVATVQITNTLTGEFQTLTTMMPVSANNEQSIKFSVSYSHCGKIHITLKNIKVYDYVKLFSKNIDINLTKEITVLPSLININPEIKTTLSGTFESDEFSKIKPGDDCSEIFEIREYNYGDKINRIHWNLTTKLDELMVKQYSLPVSSQITVILEFCIDEKSNEKFYKTDALIESVMSISNFMNSNGISYKLCWFDVKNQIFRCEKISSDEDFYEFLGSIFVTGTYTDSYSAFIHHYNENAGNTFSHTIYVSPVLSDEIWQNLSIMKNSKNTSYVYISDDEILPDFFESNDDISAVFINFRNIAEGLEKIII